jgi:malonyl-CoA decarboxylase
MSSDTADVNMKIPVSVPETSGNILARLSKWWTRKDEKSSNLANGVASGAATLGAREARRMREQLRRCFDARLTDVAANEAAREWRDRYAAAAADVQLAMLGILADVAAEAGTSDSSRGSGSQLTQALSNARIRFFKRLNGLEAGGGLRFLLGLRADMLRARKQFPALKLLDEDLEGLFSNWFDVGLLELRRISWDSPASLLEKLIVYEAVHEIASWADLRNRLDSDRRCYAFFHPRLPQEPLIFVEVAFVPEMAGNVQALLDETAPLEDLSKVRWAIFYSISNTQTGLRGVSFGNFLLKRVVEEIQTEFPKLKQFATLSPIPGFADWLRKQSAENLNEVFSTRALARHRSALGEDAGGAAWLTWLQSDDADESEGAIRQSIGIGVAAHYLAKVRDGDLPADPVARFHLGNGAQMERLNWRADASKKGKAQSCGMMVNYLYELDALDDNLAQLGEGKPRLGRGIARLL